MASQVAIGRPTKETPISEQVVSAVAATKGTDPVDLEPLYEVIEPDALDALFDRDGFRGANPPKRIEFTYSGCEVVVAGDGSVTVSELAP